MDLKNSKLKQEKNKEASRTKLVKIVEAKIKTTMIGALASIEKHFQFLWEDDGPEAREMKELYAELRAEILDKGNGQIRKLEAELNGFEIARYSTILPVIQRGV